MKRKYRVGFYYEENGYIEVEATSQEEAENKVYKSLEDNGLPLSYDCKDRDYNTTSSEAIN